jgi:small subunit ribosomal protein S11
MEESKEIKKETKAAAEPVKKDIKVQSDPIKRDNRPMKKGIVHIYSTFNNTIVSVADTTGKLASWSSAGSCGFKGSRKGTPFAAQMAAETAGKRAADKGFTHAEVFVKGPGTGRESAIRAVQTVGLKITVIKDVTPIPHNGCRPRKKRRV